MIFFFKDSLIIADELQNATKSQILMLLTRIGKGSKIICTGDPDQSDLYGKNKFMKVAHGLSQINDIDIAELSQSVRHPLIEEIISGFNDID